MNNIDHALEYIARGWHVFPVHFVPTTCACSCRRPDCDSPGKHPVTHDGLTAATTDEAQVRAWWKERPHANIGIATGEKSGFDVIDIDPRHGGDDTWRDIERTHGDLVSQEALTGGGGRHILIAYSGELYSRADVFAGVDVKSDGGYIVAPPSNHASGRRYSWDVGTLDNALADARTWGGWPTMLEQFSAPIMAAENGVTSPVNVSGEPIPEGSRNMTLIRVAGRLRAQGLDLEPMAASLRIYNDQYCRPPLDESEILAVAKSACRYERGTPLAEMFAGLPTAVDVVTATTAAPVDTTETDAGSDANPATPDPVEDPTTTPPPETTQVHPYTDVGNRDRLIERFGSSIMHISQHGWYCWTGGRWRIDDAGLLQEMMITTARKIRTDEAGIVFDSKGVDKSLNWSLQSENKSRIKNAIDLASSAYGIPHSVDDLDSHPYLFNATNATIDLRTGKPMPHNSAHRLTQMSRMEYIEFAECERWRRFISEIMAGKVAVARHLQKILGYAMSGDMSAEMMAILFGDGANGKSVMLEVLQHLLGDYAKTAPAHTFLESRNGGGGDIRNDLAMLRGARTVSVSETNKGQYLDESLIKRLSSGDRETARFLHKEYFEFSPQYKVLMATNNKPEIKGASHGTWRRIHLIEFAVKFGEPGHPPAENKAALVAELKSEASGILLWLLDGFRMYQKEGLTPPPEVANATRSYREDMDPVLEFFEDCCMVGDDITCKVSDAAEAYNAYSNTDLSTRGFGRKMADHGYRSRRSGGGTIRVYDGFDLNQHGKSFLNRNNRGFGS